MNHPQTMSQLRQPNAVMSNAPQSLSQSPFEPSTVSIANTITGVFQDYFTFLWLFFVKSKLSAAVHCKLIRHDESPSINGAQWCQPNTVISNTPQSQSPFKPSTVSIAMLVNSITGVLSSLFFYFVLAFLAHTWSRNSSAVWGGYACGIDFQLIQNSNEYSIILWIQKFLSNFHACQVPRRQNMV